MLKEVVIAASIYPPDPGGPATHAKKYYDGFRARGITAYVVALASYRRFPRWLRHLSFFLALVKRSWSSEVIYAHDAWGVGFPALLAARLTRNKLVLRIGGDMAWERSGKEASLSKSLCEWYTTGVYQNSPFYKLTKIVLLRADKVIVPSKLLFDIYIKYYNVGEDRMEVIPNPIPKVEKIDTAVTTNIVYASRLVPYKNLKLVIHAFSRVTERYPETRLIIMGDGPEKASLEKLTSDLRLSRNVIFRGRVSQEEVLRETAQALFIIAPALTEFNPNYVLQGLAYEKPFLISRENGLPFRVPEEFLLEPRQQRQVEERMLFLLDADNYSNAKELLSKIDFKMSWEDVIDANLKVLESLKEIPPAT